MSLITQKQLVENHKVTRQKFDCIEFNKDGKRELWYGCIDMQAALEMITRCNMQGHLCLIVKHNDLTRQAIHNFESKTRSRVSFDFVQKYAVDFKTLISQASKPDTESEHFEKVELGNIVELKGGAIGEIIQKHHSGHGDIRAPYCLSGGFVLKMINRIGHLSVLPPRMELEYQGEVEFSDIESIMTPQERDDYETALAHERELDRQESRAFNTCQA